MQGFNDPPRQGFTRQNILDLIGWAPDVNYDVGMEVLTIDLNPAYDLSSYLVKDPASKISWRASDEIHRTTTYSTEYNHNWGVDRVRPYVLLSCPRLVPNGPARFDLGVYIVTTQSQPLGDANPIFPVTGYDLTYLLTTAIGDTYSLGAGANYFAAVSAAIQAAVGNHPFVLNLDSTKADAVLPNDMSWPLASDSAGTRYLDVINELLAAINYNPIWADHTGAYRSEPYVDPANRTPEFIFGAGDTTISERLDSLWQYHGVVSDADRTVQRDTWNTPNHWRFIQNDLTFEPIEGSGQFTYDNVSNGPTSQAVVGRVIQGPTQYLSASGQADLVAQAQKLINADIYPTETVSFKSALIPIASHNDVVQYLDATLPGSTQSRQLIVQSWDMPLFVQDDMSWTCISTPPAAEQWSTGTSGEVNAKTPGGGGLPSVPNWDPPIKPGGTYRPPTPVVPGLPESGL